MFTDFNDFENIDADVLFPLTEGCSRKILDNLSCSNQAVLPSSDVINLAQDKMAFSNYLKEKGYSQYLPLEGKDVNSYPYVLKGRTGFYGDNVFIVENEEHEKQYLDRLRSSKNFKQEFLEGCEEYALYYIFDGSNFVYLNEIKYTYEERYFVKSSRYKATSIESRCECSFKDIFSDILRELNYNGFGCYNYKIVDDQLKIIELNPRIGASMKRGFLLEGLDAYVKLVAEKSNTDRANYNC